MEVQGILSLVLKHTHTQTHPLYLREIRGHSISSPFTWKIQVIMLEVTSGVKAELVYKGKKKKRDSAGIR